MQKENVTEKNKTHLKNAKVRKCHRNSHISSQIIITFFFSMCYNPRHVFISVMRSTFKTVVCDLSSDV